MGEAKRRRLARVEVWRSQALDDVDRRIIDRLVEAVRTGEHCGTSQGGPRHVAAISDAGFSLLNHRNIMAVAMGTVGEIEDPHPRAQQRFLRAWMRNIGGLLREYTCNDEAFFSGLRVLLPPYRGPAVTLFRGQQGDYPPGVSWSDNYWVALRFCMHGIVPRGASNPSELMKGPIPGLPRLPGGVIMRATVQPSAVLCATHDSYPQFEREFIIDPRRLLPRDVEIDWGDGT